MRAPVKLAAFGGCLLVAFAAAFGVGSAFGSPVQPSPAATGSGAGAGHDAHSADTTGGAPAAEPAQPAEADVPAGLMVSDRGYTLSLASAALPSGDDVPVSFRILGPDGEAVTSYVVDHDEDLHLIAVRRDGSGYQHVHPELADDGTWSVPVDLTPGSWRLFADFVPGSGAGEPVDLTLGADLAVAGDHVPQPVPPASRTAEVDGYTVTLAGDLEPGAESEVGFTVTRDGQPVTDLEPYLGAYGHLVALRGGDLAYLHVHPTGEPGDGTTSPGPDVAFSAAVPSAGQYWLFLDFQHAGEVRTAQFTALAGEGTGPTAAPSAAPAPGETPASDGHDDDH